MSRTNIDGGPHATLLGVPTLQVPGRNPDFCSTKGSAMRQDVIARERDARKEARLDAIVSVSPENFAYVTGFLSPTQPLMRWRHAMAVVTAEGATALIVVDMEANTIASKAPGG